MSSEAQITINGTALSEQESRMVRLALDSLADIIGSQMGMKDKGFALADDHLAAIGRVRYPMVLEFLKYIEES
jgi:hypothetical protein